MKKFILFVFISFSLVCNGQEKDPADFKFNHLALSVTDLQKSVEFYSNVLDLKEITNRGKLEGVRWFSLGEGKELHLISIVKESISTNKAVHLALTTLNFDAFITKLKNLSIQYSDWPGTLNKIHVRADGIKQIFFQDPDGYWIEVNSEK
jgi:lactoylglutathione lyase